jgi:glycosyltransferase involved in cell wall biosynthesis
MKLSIIIPALNEEVGIREVIKQIPMKKLKNMGYLPEIIVVDNGSTDRTAEIAKKAGAIVVSQPIRGYGNAYKAGFASAKGVIIATGDADMTYPFDALPEILTKMSEGKYDFINTNRLTNLNPEAMTTSHIFGNWFLSKTIRMLFGSPFRDSQSGMWIFKRSILAELELSSGGMPFSQELKIEAHIKGFKCVEVPIEYRPRAGKAKLNTVKDGMGNVVHLLKKRLSPGKMEQP